MGRHVRTFYSMTELPTRKYLENGERRNHPTIMMRFYFRHGPLTFQLCMNCRPKIQLWPSNGSWRLAICTETGECSYLRSCQRFLLCTQHTTTSNLIENEYPKLKQYIELQAAAVERQAQTPWISSDTWKLIDSRASKSKNRSFHPGKRPCLSRHIKRAIQHDRKQRITKAGDEIEQNLQAGCLKAAWNVLQNWYKHTGDRPPRPTWLDLRQVTKEYRSLYQANIPFGNPIHTHITHCAINNELPNEQEIAEAVRKLKNGKAPGPFGIWAKHLKPY
jgi:hypothetical protein